MAQTDTDKLKTSLVKLMCNLKNGGLAPHQACEFVQKAVNDAFAEFVPDEPIFYGNEIHTPTSSAMSPAIGTQSEFARVFTKAPPSNHRVWHDSVGPSSHLASPKSSPAAKVSQDKVMKPARKDKRSGGHKGKGKLAKTGNMFTNSRLPIPKGGW